MEHQERTVWVNGQWLAEQNAQISIFDRGLLFGDAIYEVFAVVDGGAVDFDGHVGRLDRSLDRLGIENSLDKGEYRKLVAQMISRNGLNEGLVYLQISRGSFDRSFDIQVGQPNLFLFTQAMTVLDNPQADKGISVVTLDDVRWRHRDIKTTQLLAASLAKQEAAKQGAQDAWFVDPEGKITEGSSNNAYIITQDNCLITHPLNHEVLHGITRHALLQLVERTGIKLVERGFYKEELSQAAEAFGTSASRAVMPVVAIDGHPIGSGEPGHYTQQLQSLYAEHCRASAKEFLAQR